MRKKHLFHLLYILLNLLFFLPIQQGYCKDDTRSILPSKEPNFDVPSPVKQRLIYVVNDILLNTIKENKIKDIILLGVFNEGVVAKETAFIITRENIYIFELYPFSRETDLDPPKLFKTTSSLLDKIGHFKRNDFENEKISVMNLSTDNSAICIYDVDSELNIKNALIRYFFPSDKIKDIVSEINEIKTTQTPVIPKNFKTVSSLRIMEEQNILQLAEYFINKIMSDTPISREDEKKIFGLNNTTSNFQKILFDDLRISNNEPKETSSELIYSPLCELIRINKTLFLKKDVQKKLIYISHSSWECSEKYKCTSGLNIIVFVKLVYVDRDSLLIELIYNPFSGVFFPDFYIYKGDSRNSLLEIGFYWDKQNQKLRLKKDVLIRLEKHLNNLYNNHNLSLPAALTKE